MATVVFADLVGSTGMFERLGDATAGRFVTQLTAALARTVEQHRGRVVKRLGDGVFATFPTEQDAVAACTAIHRDLHAPAVPGDAPVRMRIGIDSGEVVEIEGDCYGDAVNSAARLADLAGAQQILATRRVRDALPHEQQLRMRSLGPMYLRGKSEATEVFRLDWQTGRDLEATMMGAMPLVQPVPRGTLELSAGGPVVTLQAHGAPATLGRSPGATLTINDSRVSRLHATVQWSSGHFVLSDQSSYGTWVYVGGQTTPVALRRTDCPLVGEGVLTLGCDRDTPGAPTVAWRVAA